MLCCIRASSDVKNSVGRPQKCCPTEDSCSILRKKSRSRSPVYAANELLWCEIKLSCVTHLLCINIIGIIIGASSPSKCCEASLRLFSVQQKCNYIFKSQKKNDFPSDIHSHPSFECIEIHGIESFRWRTCVNLYLLWTGSTTSAACHAEQSGLILTPLQRHLVIYLFSKILPAQKWSNSFCLFVSTSNGQTASSLWSGMGQ